VHCVFTGVDDRELEWLIEAILEDVVVAFFRALDGLA